MIEEEKIKDLVSEVDEPVEEEEDLQELMDKAVHSPAVIDPTFQL